MRAYLGSPQSQKVTFGNSCWWSDTATYNNSLIVTGLDHVWSTYHVDLAKLTTDPFGWAHSLTPDVCVRCYSSRCVVQRVVCAFFTLNRPFYSSTSTTPRVRECIWMQWKAPELSRPTYVDSTCMYPTRSLYWATYSNVPWCLRMDACLPINFELMILL